MLIATKVCKAYNQVPVIQNVDFQVYPGTLVAIVGPSGAGKTTLLNLLSTLERPDSGTVQLDGIDLKELKGAALAEFRNKKIGFVFQFHHLLPEFTLFENVCMPGYIGTMPKQEVEQKAHALIQLLGINHCQHALPAHSSGGERQRAAIARALLLTPSVVFADEPSGSLDTKHAALLHMLFKELCTSLQQTFVCVTHNPALTAIADQVFVLEDGLLRPA
jgi:lipoprotein-releasing system ATP-binding protein